MAKEVFDEMRNQEMVPSSELETTVSRAADFHGRESNSPPKRPMRALIVDDSRPMRRVEAEILQALGFETTDACHGKQALSQLQDSPLPDVALVDWKMPEMDGLQFIKAVRSDARFCGLVILMVTTETESDQVLTALAAGADEYLMKPFDKRALLDKLRLVGVVI